MQLVGQSEQQRQPTSTSWGAAEPSSLHQPVPGTVMRVWYRHLGDHWHSRWLTLDPSTTSVSTIYSFKNILLLRCGKNLIFLMLRAIIFIKPTFSNFTCNLNAQTGVMYHYYVLSRHQQLLQIIKKEDMYIVRSSPARGVL